MKRLLFVALLLLAGCGGGLVPATTHPASTQVVVVPTPTPTPMASGSISIH